MITLLRTAVVGLLLFAVTGCGATPAPAATSLPPTTAPTAAPPAPTEAATAAAAATPDSTPISVVTVGIDPSFEPFVFMREATLAGFDVDLLNAMAAEGGFEVAFVVTSFDEIFDGLEGGQYDAAISAITVTEARKARVDFTAPYFESGKAPVSFFNPGQGIAIRNDNTTIAGVENLVAGVRVGVKRGTTGAAFAAESTEAELVEFPDSESALSALVAGELDAVIVDIPVIVGHIRNFPDDGIRITGGPVTDEMYAIAVSKDKPAVRAALDAALTNVQASGAYDQIFNRWFGTP